MIFSILKKKPGNRPSIEEILGSKYVGETARQFGWNLKKLTRFRPMLLGDSLDRAKPEEDVLSPRSFAYQMQISEQSRMNAQAIVKMEKGQSQTLKVSLKPEHSDSGRELGLKPQSNIRMNSLHIKSHSNKMQLANQNSLNHSAMTFQGGSRRRLRKESERACQALQPTSCLSSSNRLGQNPARNLSRNFEPPISSNGFADLLVSSIKVPRL